ncbi:MAG: dTDP-4-dehydrorhamnose reductase [Gammaproteobacteria bacterium]
MESAVVTGAGGQLGLTLQLAWAGSPAAEKFDLHPFPRAELDCTERPAIDRALAGLNCRVLINAAAYTRVDQAEQEAEAAHGGNESAVRNLGSWCAENNCRLIHISTDFVFDGKQSVPYSETDATNPLGVYGRSKLAGEQALSEVETLDAVILRTSWLYSSYGNNFVKTMLRLMAEKDKLQVVIDQVGSPTSTHSLVKVIMALIHNPSASGIYHWCDGAEISWYDFALAIQRIAIARGLLQHKIPIHPIPTKAYPTAAKRPEYSVLDRAKALDDLNVVSGSWQEELGRVLAEIESAQPDTGPDS